jgi:hypothetical protein
MAAAPTTKPISPMPLLRPLDAAHGAVNRMT